MKHAPWWPKVVAADSPDAYVRKTLLNVYLSETRRMWRRRERSSDDPTAGAVESGACVAGPPSR
jgi:hypothetical protein